MKVALYTPIRNETRIVEFITHYVLLGFDYFILFDDNSDKPISDVLSENNFDLNMFKVIKNVFYKDIKGIYLGSHWHKLILPILYEMQMDYLFNIDADEILYLKNYTNIKDLINSYSPFDSIYINWLCIGDNIKTNDSDSVINTFTRCPNTLFPVGKSLVKVSSLSIDGTENFICPHFIKLKQNSMRKDIYNTIYDSKNINLSVSQAPIYLAHYLYQDITTYVERKVCSDLHIEVYYYHVSEYNMRTKLLSNLKKYKEQIIDCVYNNCSDLQIIEMFKEVDDEAFFDFVKSVVNRYNHVLFDKNMSKNLNVINFHDQLKCLKHNKI